MKKIVIEVSDKKRKNTTVSKIKDSLRKYKNYDTVRFRILDLYRAPCNDVEWEQMTKILYQIINDIEEEKAIKYDASYYDVRRIKVEVENAII